MVMNLVAAVGGGIAWISEGKAEDQCGASMVGSVDTQKQCSKLSAHYLKLLLHDQQVGKDSSEA